MEYHTVIKKNYYTHNMNESISQALQWIKEAIHKGVPEGEIGYPNMNISSTCIYYRISLNQRSISFSFLQPPPLFILLLGTVFLEEAQKKWQIKNILETMPFREFYIL